MKLKTLKEIDGLTSEERDYIRKEAVKWARNYNFMSCMKAEEWIKHFFNLSSEDLKDDA